MLRDMKFHIYNLYHKPLSWELGESEDDNDRAIEFDSEEEAKEFWELVKSYCPEICENFSGIVRDILYYDGGYIDGALATELIKKELKEGMENDINYWKGRKKKGGEF